MEIKIRNIDPSIIYAIDKIIQELNQNSKHKISRNDFLKAQIEKIPEQQIYKKVDSDVAVQLKMMSNLRKDNNFALNAIFKLLFIGDDDVANDLLDEISKREREHDAK